MSQGCNVSFLPQDGAKHQFCVKWRHTGIKIALLFFLIQEFRWMFQVFYGFIYENFFLIFAILNISDIFNILIQTQSTPPSAAAPSH